jgi:hypothetical protein
MLINNIIKIDPNTRVNDLFVRNDSINASAVLNDIKHPLVKGLPNSADTRYQADFYKNIAIDIAVETVLNYPYAYISEKSLRAFACKRMLIVLGAPGVLLLLKDKGFQTFGDFIDESYDQIFDPVDRLAAVVKEVRRICSKPLHEIVAYLEKNQTKLDHNFQNLLQLQDIELMRIEDQIHNQP